MEEHGMTFVAFSPLAQARLLDKYNPDNPPEFELGDHRKDSSSFSAEAIAALKPKLQKLKERFGDTTEDLVAVALNYVLAQPRVACVIPGFRNERQARCNVGAAGRPLSEDDIRFVREALA
jgi:aryl-alcohol dehydrogenase-like predicted oxidoreductase